MRPAIGQIIHKTFLLGVEAITLSHSTVSRSSIGSVVSISEVPQGTLTSIVVANGADMKVHTHTAALVDDSETNDSLADNNRKMAISKLIEKLDAYLLARQEGLAAPRNTYFWGGISYARKLNAVTALKEALAFDSKKGHTPVDLQEHMTALRDGHLRKMLREFIRGSSWQPKVQVDAQCIVGDEIMKYPRIRDFMAALTHYNNAAYTQHQSSGQAPKYNVTV